MTPTQTLAEAAVKLATLVIRANAGDGAMAALDRSRSVDLATDILEIDHARRAPGANVLPGPWKSRPDQPQGAA